MYKLHINGANPLIKMENFLNVLSFLQDVAGRIIKMVPKIPSSGINILYSTMPLRVVEICNYDGSDLIKNDSPRWARPNQDEPFRSIRNVLLLVLKPCCGEMSRS